MNSFRAVTLITLALVEQSLGFAAKRVVIEKYRFSIDAPAGWRVGVSEKDGLPVFVNVAWPKFGPQLHLPKGGASIHIIAEEALPGRVQDYTLEKWLEFGQVTSKAGTASSRTLETSPSTGITRALLSEFDEATFGPDDQPQRSVSVYWEFLGKRFAMHLFYIVGDPQGKHYEDLLTKATRSIRPLQ
jgi:hypothetical protein